MRPNAGVKWADPWINNCKKIKDSPLRGRFRRIFSNLGKKVNNLDQFSIFKARRTVLIFCNDFKIESRLCAHACLRVKIVGRGHYRPKIYSVGVGVKNIYSFFYKSLRVLKVFFIIFVKMLLFSWNICKLGWHSGQTI